MNLIDLSGAIGGSLFVMACVPMAWRTIKGGKSVVTDRATIWTFVSACTLFGAYLIGKTGLWNLPSLSIIVELVAWAIVAWYSYFPRPKKIDMSYVGRRRLEEYIAPMDEQCHGRGCSRYHHGASCPHYFEEFSECTREPLHTGPCNGYPSQDCRVWISHLGKPASLREINEGRDGTVYTSR